ncbi:hypothetical protein ESCO_003511 [Escovopsis weberi]|uniref:Essential protein Yae1 N-terminal domain-containing protein n=1 Tax=Escovopsis weberi TaxID=150374 RepID=A0A0M8N9G6_ESCWE|nr:hypothetical protein ESCO_003511 [Escovopsis weberi]
MVEGSGGTSTDPLDEVFTLEDKFYSQGYSQGFEDGAQAGRIEGRSLGMEKGFDKFCESGRLSAKSVIWLNRLPGSSSKKPAEASQASSAPSSSAAPTQAAAAAAAGDSNPSVRPAEAGCTLPPLPNNPRLEKNIRMLYALVEPETFSVENTDEAVQDFDDRVKRAQGKAKVIERMISHR